MPKAIPLPRGRHNLSREQIASSQRTRLIRATVELANKRGFASLTLTDIVSRAGVARVTFYEYFTDKEQCFLDAFEYATDLVLERVLMPFVPADSASLVQAYAKKFLELCLQEPDLAQLVAANVGTLGPAAAEKQRVSRDRLAKGLVDLRSALHRADPKIAQISHIRALAIVGAITEVLQHAFHQAGSDAVSALQAELTMIMHALLEAPPASSRAEK